MADSAVLPADRSQVSSEHPPSLAVAPLILDQRCYGETPGRLRGDPEGFLNGTAQPKASTLNGLDAVANLPCQRIPFALAVMLFYRIVGAAVLMPEQTWIVWELGRESFRAEALRFIQVHGGSQAVTNGGVNRGIEIQATS